MFNVQQGWKRSSLFSKVGGDVHCSVGLKEKFNVQQSWRRRDVQCSAGLEEKKCSLFSRVGGEEIFTVQSRVAGEKDVQCSTGLEKKRCSLLSRVGGKEMFTVQQGWR